MNTKHHEKIKEIFSPLRGLVILSLIFVVFSVPPKVAGATSASLYLSPPSGTYTVGSIFSVKVKVDSEGEAINAAEGTLIFNPDGLSVVSISESGSIFTLWTTKPTFSNPAGTISFGGGTPKNFTGSSGTIITISFRAKTIGTFNLNFSTGSVLAADYKGTNVLASMGSGIYVIQPKIVTPEYIPPENAPVAPIISSPTHPDPEKWYSNDDPEFTWEVPEDITGVKLLADHNSITIPTVFYSEPISEKQLEDLSDGIWYFHAQLRNKFGWGGVSHFKFQIDTNSPNPFEIEVKEGKETANPRPTLVFKTTDELSGIDYYEVKIDEASPIKVEKPEYKLPQQTIGKHTIIVQAVDRAGNGILSVSIISIIPSDFTRIGGIIIDYLSITIVLLVLIAAITSGSLWIWRKIKQRRMRLEKETTEAEKALYRAFKTLRKEIKEQVAKLDGKPGLSGKEKKICDDLKKSLKISEKFIEKEIKDIEKELKIS